MSIVDRRARSSARRTLVIGISAAALTASILGTAGGPALAVTKKTTKTTKKAVATTAAPTTAAPTTAPKKDLGKATMLVGGGAAPGAALAPQASLPAQLGYWKAEGLDVTVQTGVTGDAQAVQLLDSGQGTVAVVSPTSLMSAREKGLDVVGAYVYIRKPLNSMYVRDNSPVASIDQLNNRIIGSYASAGGPIEEAKFMIDENGGSFKSVSIINIGFSIATVEQIRSEKVDAYVVTEPDFFTAQGLKLRKLPDKTEAGRFGFLYVFKRSYMEKNPEAVVAMLRGVAKATEFAMANPSAAIKLHWQQYPVTKPTGMSDAEAMASTLVSVSGRYDKYRVPAGEKYGLVPNMAARWSIMEKLGIEATTITKPAPMADGFTDKFIAQVNDFDRAQIKAEAEAAK